MRQNKWKVSVISIEMFFFLFPFFLSFRTMVRPIHMEVLYYVWVTLACFSVAVKFVSHRRKISLAALITVASTVLLLFATLRDFSNIRRAVIDLAPIAVFVVLLDYYTFDIKKLVGIVLLCFEIVLYMNLISVILYPNGMQAANDSAKRWLLGHYGSQLSWYCPAFAVCLINIRLKQNVKRAYILLLDIIITSFYIGSATLVVSMTLFFVIILVPYLRHHVNYVWAVITNILFLLMVLVLKNQALFSYLIVDILHKDLTFSNRTYIWDYAALMIAQKPLTGYGYFYYIPTWFNSQIRHAHNQYLHIMIQGGVGYLVLFLIQNYVANKSLKHSQSGEFSGIIQSALFALLFAGCTDVFFNVPVPYLLFILAAYVNKFDVLKEDNLIKYGKKV